MFGFDDCLVLIVLCISRSLVWYEHYAVLFDVDYGRNWCGILCLVWYLTGGCRVCVL